MKPISLLLLFAAMLSMSLSAQPPQTSEVILKEACQQAAKEHKKVMIIFHASWCVWCRKMDTAMHDVSVRDFFQQNYVVRHLTILEAPDKKHLENPGAHELYKKYAGENSGIPFWLVYDSDGKLLADSNIKPGENAGCPATKEEVDYFIKVLKQTSPITPIQAEAVEKRFRKNEL